MAEFPHALLGRLQAQLQEQSTNSHAVFLLQDSLLLLASGICQQSLAAQGPGCLPVMSAPSSCGMILLFVSCLCFCPFFFLYGQQECLETTLKQHSDTSEHGCWENLFTLTSGPALQTTTGDQGQGRGQGIAPSPLHFVDQWWAGSISGQLHHAA